MQIANFLFLKIIAVAITSVALASSSEKNGCQFPKSWSGKWFQSGQQKAIVVNQTHINFKGMCIEADRESDRFLVEDKSERENCYRCMAIHEKHRNVLQYKETNCLTAKTVARMTLDTICEEITGDAPLYSMFRLDAKPESCPFKGGPPFTFTYDRGYGECKSPVSKSDACTDDSRMLLRYQACPDIHGSESTVEELTCLALWRDGPMRYMVGKLEHKMTSSDEDRYRCFVWNGSDNAYNMAQSGDATCNGLQSATEGWRTMRLTKADQTHHQNGANCIFPTWLTAHFRWDLLDRSKMYHFSSRNGTLSVTSVRDDANVLEMRAVCNSILETSDRHAMITAHITIGCESGYRCMSFYKRDGHVIEIQQSNKEVQNSEEACISQNFNPQTLPFTTLIAESLQRRDCPFLGRYTISNNNDLWKMAASTNQIRATYAEDKPPCENGKQILSLGCNKADTMEFVSECSSDIYAAYSCHGDWVDSNGTSYLIALPLNQMSVSSDRYCFVIYNMPDAAASAASLSGGQAVGPRRVRHLQLYSLKSCRRDLLAGDGGKQNWMFNITHHADCDGLVSGAFSTTKERVVWLVGTQVVFVAVFSLTRHFR